MQNSIEYAVRNLSKEQSKESVNVDEIQEVPESKEEPKKKISKSKKRQTESEVG